MDRTADAGQVLAVRVLSGLACCQAAVVLTAGAGAPTGKTTAERSSNPSSVFPLDGATGICPDTPLRITFGAPPTLGADGKIQIFDATGDTKVETIDVAVPTATKTIGGLSGYKYHPVIISGAEATIHLRNGALSYNKTYYVTVDPGVFKDGAGHATAPRTAWRFTTRAAPPPAGTAKLTVAPDSTADFCTVQGAFDFIPDGNTAPTTIFVRKGTYTEIVFFTNKHAITLRGEDRRHSVI